MARLKCCFTSTETVGVLGTGVQDVHATFTQLLSSKLVSYRVQCCLTSTETIMLIILGSGSPGRPPRLSQNGVVSSSVLLYVHGKHKDY